MMTEHQAEVQSGMLSKAEQLKTLYSVYSGWVERIPLACQKGCAACCTQSVTITSIEGEMLLAFLKEGGKEKSLPQLLAQRTTASPARLTTNQYAEACLEHREIDQDILGEWNFTPCIFLSEGVCSIYEARPFGCRSFGSFVRCSDSDGAEISPIHLTVNTVFTQIIEHLCSDGGYWGNMADILENLIEKEPSGPEGNLLPAQPVPGFLLDPQEVRPIHVLLTQLYGQSVEKQTFGDLIDNFMPI